MRVLGVTPTSQEVSWAIVKGAKTSPQSVSIESDRQRYPKGQNEEIILLNLYEFVLTLLKEHQVDKVCILQAGTNRFGAQSSLRTKAEGIFQLAGAKLNLEVCTVAPQTLRAQEKRFVSMTTSTVEDCLNAGKDFKPKPRRDTALTAWVGLP